MNLLKNFPNLTEACRDNLSHFCQFAAERAFLDNRNSFGYASVYVGYSDANGKNADLNYGHSAFLSYFPIGTGAGSKVI